MIHFEANSADEVWSQAVDKLRSVAPIQESRDQNTRELLHATFTLHDPRQRIVFRRPINPAFAIAEVIWILAGANGADFLRFWNPRMMRFTDDQDRQLFHGAYGFRLGSQPTLNGEAPARLRHEIAPAGAPDGVPRLDQIRTAYEALRQTPHSRQVVLQIWDSRFDLPRPAPMSRDIPCNLVSHLLVRNGKLEWLQVMRSNDLIWGTPYNFIQFTTIQEIIAGWLGVEVGTYNHLSDSLHVYERHWADLATFETAEMERRHVPVNHADLRIASYEEWERLWARLVDDASRLATYTAEVDLLDVARQATDLPPAYAQWIALLTAEALRRRGYGEVAHKAVAQAGDFWATSWIQWADSMSSRPAPEGANVE
ncbi:MAG TPA: thymidylate synthase [Ktedonobacterales bacterium]|nr:thymidylate synthase [Ktedonobacterales bacterium]